MNPFEHKYKGHERILECLCGYTGKLSHRRGSFREESEWSEIIGGSGSDGYGGGLWLDKYNPSTNQFDNKKLITLHSCPKCGLVYCIADQIP